MTVMPWRSTSPTTISCAFHQTLRVTPAMESGLTDHVWTVEELIALMPVEQPKKRGPYKKRLAA